MRIGTGRWSARPCRMLGVLAGLTLAGVGSLSAQMVRGSVFDGRTGRPLSGVFIVLAGDDDGELARTLTSASGAFEFANVTEPGWLRVERVGFEDDRFPERVVANGGPYRIPVMGTRLSFEPVPPGNEEGCLVAPGEDSESGRRWREVRKALAAVRWTGAAPELDVQLQRYDRVLDPNGLVLGETAGASSERTLPPRSGLPADRIDSLGFVVVDPEGVPVFVLPTPEVLLRADFPATHCFLARESTPTSAELTGLSFRPIRSDDRTDIGGTFWIDRESGELRRLEFSYAGRSVIEPGSGPGGRLAFARLPTGEWIVREWERIQPGVDGIVRRVGGLVTTVAVGGDVRYEDEHVTLLTGSVFDSTAGGPLHGAVVALAGTDAWTTTDVNGAFFLTGHFDGRYDVLFGHPRLDSLGFISPKTSVELRPRETMNISLAVPSVDGILASRCPEMIPTPLSRVIVGVVRDPAGRPVPGAEVTASWQMIPPDLQGFAVDDQEATAVTDTLGTYTLCSVSLGRRVVVHAAVADRLSDFVSVLFDGDAVRIGRDRGTLDDRPVARIDLTLADAAAFHTAVRGTVTESGTGHPIDGVQVMVSGTPLSVVTGADGRFELRGIPPGTHRLTARRVGYRRVRSELEVEPGETVEMADAALAMPGGVVELAPIIVEATAVPRAARHLATSGFLDRRDQGIGRFVTRDEFETWRPTQTTDVLRRTGGIRVTPNPSYGFNGDTRKYLIGTSREAGRIAAQGTRECPAIFFVDGVYAGTSADPSAYIDTMLSVGTIEAIEVYSGPAQTPAQFNRPGADCGVIVFWTR